MTSRNLSLRPRRGHKERSKNFSEAEKRTVLELIARHRDVLRQGRSNNATNRSKQLVWSTICEEVNKRCGGERPRTPAQVKMWYENYKKKCKMRAQETQQTSQEPSGLLDGMLWQSMHPLDVTEDEGETSAAGEGLSVKDEDCGPVNMSNGRSTDDSLPNVLEPHVQIIPQSPPVKALLPLTPFIHNPLLDQVRMQHSISYLQKLNELSNTPLNLSHLESREEPRSSSRSPSDKHDFTSATDEERSYFAAKREHAAVEHEAKMRILNMELKQKEEIFSLQKQLFLVELKLKMDFLEKAAAK